VPVSKPIDKPLVIAAFDFDGTLTRRDTLLPFLARGLGCPRLMWALLTCSPWLVAFALRLIPNHVAKQKLLLATLKSKTMAEIDDWTSRWLTHDFPDQLQRWTMARLTEHQQAGHCCVMVSASPDIYLKRVSQQIGLDALLCTEMERVSGPQGEQLTGLMKTPNCHGDQKVLRLQAWMAERFGATADGAVLYAYGDTSGDKPMLRMAAHAFYRGEPWRGEGPG
jgi:phosphatidylglycerophosphatase C